MPSKTDEIIAEFEKLLAKRGATFRPTDRLGLERAPLSREFQNEPLPGYEKAAAILGAALSPGSTIASMVLAPPAEETIFERQIKGPDGKLTILPKTSESVVPRMKKQERAAQKPNPIMDALQRHFKLGPHADPANDIASQKINDRNFLVHATRPKDAKWIQKTGTIMPGSSSDTLPDIVLNDPLIRKGIADGTLQLNRSSLDGKLRLERTTDGHEYLISKKMKSGKPGEYGSVSPGVSLSRQMIVPELNADKSYRFLVKPNDRPTFSTSEPGYGKAYVPERFKTYGLDLHESEQRTFGGPYPVLPGNRATVANEPKKPTEEFVRPGAENYYRATMGNEQFRHIRERIGEVFGGSNYKKYKELKNRLDELHSNLNTLQLKLGDKGSDSPEWKTIVPAWRTTTDEIIKINNQLKSLNLPDYLKY